MRSRPLPWRRMSWSVALGPALALSLRAQQTPDAPTVSAPTTTQIRADLAQLRSALTSVEKSWPAGQQDSALARLARLEAAVDTVRLPYLLVEVGRIVALADNGHTSLSATARSSKLNRVPIRLLPFERSFYVAMADSVHADLVGARLDAIDGRPVDVVRAAARQLSGGTDAWRDRFVPFVLESPEQLQALGMADDAQAVRYTFRKSNGALVERRLTARPAPATAVATPRVRFMYPAHGAAEAQGWPTMLDSARAPWSLQHPDVPFRFRADPELNALVIELRSTRNAGAVRIAAFLDSATAELRTRRPQHVVLDLRLNGGGDLTTARAFVKSLPTLVPGRVFVLTSPFTFSAAISTTAYLKQAAPDRVAIVGEEVGDRLEFWAEGIPMRLANLGLLVGLATQRHDYRDGCRAYRDCHHNVVRQPIAVPTLVPDLDAPWTAAAYVAGRDPGMDAVARALGRRPASR